LLTILSREAYFS